MLSPEDKIVNTEMVHCQYQRDGVSELFIVAGFGRDVRSASAEVKQSV